MNEQYITIKSTNIPIIIKSFKTAKSVKIFFKNGKITITKPTRYAVKHIAEIIKKNEEFIYNTYIKGLKRHVEQSRKWQSGENIYYKGEQFKIVRESNHGKNIHINISEANKQINIITPINSDEEQVKYVIEKGIKNIFKNNTQVLLQEKIPYWSKVTGIKYKNFTVRDATTRYGSCVTKTKALRFSGRLIMLPDKVIDAIIVHELCHIIYSNHSKNFYNLVNKHLPEYKEIYKWLRKNAKMIQI